MKKLFVVIGLGNSGFSIAKFLLQQGQDIVVMDTRAEPPCLAAFKKFFPEVKILLGNLDEAILHTADEIVLSPGVARSEPAIAKAIAKGKSVIGDIELFARHVKAPVIAITGTNAKSTVTTLVGEMARAAGLNVCVGGNLGTPALDLLAGDQLLPASSRSRNDGIPDVYVLELSSFQLESTRSLKPRVATVLNVTPDHMDRYADFAAYCKTKQLIYQNCETAVCYWEDENTHWSAQNTLYFTKQTPSNEKIFGLRQEKGEAYLAQGDQLLLPVNDLLLRGEHDQLNALAALAIGFGFGLPMQAMLNALKNFRGLPHRCQLVREYHGVAWYNDSKGTNVGATIAAISGLAATHSGKIILIAGGVGKGADFSELAREVQKHIKASVLIGESAKELAGLFKIKTEFANSMEEAVNKANQFAQNGDRVLLSPACASLDMFKNFEHRGEVFVACVNALEI
ncbi:MAG: UDP-N-acetylmuramoyl-L-alanine--D-glutamate ligase [Gammaproteobacteria bacterium]|nr:UDP-N-acetylmuramoyl-L-alanine--D-glutamate ligase [Gammaproteobacteria bacterium]